MAWVIERFTVFSFGSERGEFGQVYLSFHALTLTSQYQLSRFFVSETECGNTELDGCQFGQVYSSFHSLRITFKHNA